MRNEVVLYLEKLSRSWSFHPGGSTSVALRPLGPFSSLCSLHLLPSQVHTALRTAGQSITRRGVGERKSDFIQKASRPRRWWTRVPKNHLARGLNASFFYRAKRRRWGGKVKKVICCCNYFLVLVRHWRGCVNFFFLQPFIGGQDVSCELNKGILA